MLHWLRKHKKSCIRGFAAVSAVFGVDVSVYADARYTCRQMEQIRIMLERGLDPSELLVYKDQ